ncbi:MAG: DNA-3-methyladenine glycosylase I [Planctomycetota bacterium]|nr:DNA-3-methyladenine glycosylase I [Planctomycetota bacterium]
MKTRKRCPWLNLKNEVYVRYHDEEWGRPVHDDSKLFEMLTLEGAQAGLSWETVLKKRDCYREVFLSFDPRKVAGFTDSKIEELMKEKGIIRHRLKIESTVSNAKCFLKIQEEFGSFNAYFWSYTESKVLYSDIQTSSDYPTQTSLSAKISKDLKKRGFRFVGPTIIYAYMQATGLCQDHSRDCYLYREQFPTGKHAN